jgi:hypothetical protein
VGVLTTSVKDDECVTMTVGVLTTSVKDDECVTMTVGVRRRQYTAMRGRSILSTG